MNDAHVHEMQVQLCKPNTRGVTHLFYNVVGAAIGPQVQILTQPYDNHYGPKGDSRPL